MQQRTACTCRQMFVTRGQSVVVQLLLMYLTVPYTEFAKYLPTYCSWITDEGDRSQRPLLEAYSSQFIDEQSVCRCTPSYPPWSSLRLPAAKHLTLRCARITKLRGTVDQKTVCWEPLQQTVVDVDVDNI